MASIATDPRLSRTANHYKAPALGDQILLDVLLLSE
jgi:hypothetical protein